MERNNSQDRLDEVYFQTVERMRKVTPGIIGPTPHSNTDDQRKLQVTVSFPFGGRNLEVGRIQVSLRGDELHIDDVRVRQDDHGNFKGKGISEALLACALKLFPHVIKISAFLTLDNERVFQDGVREGLDFVQAVQRTPTFKAIAKMGYGILREQECYVEDDSPYIVVGLGLKN